MPGRRDLDEQLYPYVISVFHEATGNRLWTQIVRDRDDAVNMPQFGDGDPPAPYRIRIEYAGGDVYDEVVGGA